SKGTWSFASVAQLLEPFCEKGPRLPELLQIFPAASVEGIHLAWRPLLGGNLLHIHEAALLDPDEQRVDGSFGNVLESLLAQPRGDLVAVRRTHRQDGEHDAFQRALEHLRHQLSHNNLANQCY